MSGISETRRSPFKTLFHSKVSNFTIFRERFAYGAGTSGFGGVKRKTWTQKFVTDAEHWTWKIGLSPSGPSMMPPGDWTSVWIVLHGFVECWKIGRKQNNELP